MDALTLADVIFGRCPWPCHLWTIASIIVILAALKYLYQQVVRYFQSR